MQSVETEKVTSLVRHASGVLEKLASNSVNDTYVFTNELGERLTAAEAEAARYHDRLAELDAAQKANLDMITQPPPVAVELATECLKLKRDRDQTRAELQTAISEAAQLRAVLGDLERAKAQQRQNLKPQTEAAANKLSNFEQCLGIKMQRVRNDTDAEDAHAYFLVTFDDGLGDIGLRLLGTDAGKRVRIYADKIPRLRLAPIEQEFDAKHNLPTLLYRIRNELKAVRRRP